MKMHYDIIDPKITLKNLSNQLYQSRPPQAKNKTWRDWQTSQTGYTLMRIHRILFMRSRQ